MQHHLQKLFTDIRKCRWQIARLSYVVVYYIQIVCHLRTVFLISRLITVCIDKSDLKFLLVFTIFETNVSLQFLSGSTQTGGCTSGGWDWPQTPLQPAYSLQGTQICWKQPLQERSALPLWGRWPEAFCTGKGFLGFFFFIHTVCSHIWEYFLYLLMLAGLLYEFPDSAGQKFPPCCPETGVSAHPNGEHQMSQTGRIVERFLRGVTVSFTSFTPILAGERRSFKHGCICLKSAFVHFHIASSSWKTGRGVFDVMMS